MRNEDRHVPHQVNPRSTTLRAKALPLRRELPLRELLGMDLLLAARGPCRESSAVSADQCGIPLGPRGTVMMGLQCAKEGILLQPPLADTAESIERGTLLRRRITRKTFAGQLQAG